MSPNIVLVIVDCLRYDYALKMPFLRQLGQELPGGYWFENHWSTSHCTDPSMMHILTGKHPDELGLYSMMFDDPEYIAPEAPTFFDAASEHGYHTAFITNLQRWYNRGVKTFVDSRNQGIEYPWNIAEDFAYRLKEPWLLVLHTDDCHTNYTEGSYPAACGFTDRNLKQLYDACPRNTVFIVTADHGEGLGQAGPDGRAIKEHGYGLWDFLTHIPFVVSVKTGLHSLEGYSISELSDHGNVFDLVCNISSRNRLAFEQIRSLVFQAGAAKGVFHRGVVDPFGRQFIRARYFEDGEVCGVEKYCLPEGDVTAALELDLKAHCEQHGIVYGDISGEAAMIERVRKLGYWKDKSLSK